MGALARRLAAIVRRRKLEEDLEAELRSHVEMAVEANLRKGMTPENARREALLNFGGIEQAKELCRDERGLPVLETAIEDVRFGLRMLRRNPGFAAVIVITLSLGVGATTAIFSVVNPILFEPLPYPHAGRIAAIVETGPDGSRGGGTFAMYRQFAERARSLESIAVFRPWRPALSGADQPRRIEGSRVSAGYFHVLGVSPVVGRDFDADDDRPNGPSVVILSDAIWRLCFGGDRAVVGRVIRLDDSEYRVIGVMPQGFENVEAPSAGIWAPLQYDPALPPNGREWGHHLVTLARLRPGIGIDEASRELDRLGSALLRERQPETYDPETRFRATPLREDLTRGVRPALLAILGAAVVVLIIACQNVTNLLLARGLERRSEFALRASLGAGRRRLIRQLLTESLLLAALGGAAGLAIAKLFLRALSALAPPGAAARRSDRDQRSRLRVCFRAHRGDRARLRIDSGVPGGRERSAASAGTGSGPSDLRRPPADPRHSRGRGSRARSRASCQLGPAAAKSRSTLRRRRGFRRFAGADAPGSDERAPLRRRRNFAPILRRGPRRGLRRARRDIGRLHEPAGALGRPG